MSENRLFTIKIKQLEKQNVNSVTTKVINEIVNRVYPNLSLHVSNIRLRDTCSFLFSAYAAVCQVRLVLCIQ